MSKDAPQQVRTGTSGRRNRLLLGSLGILVGLAGLVNIIQERRAADERRRVLTTLTESSRKQDQQRHVAASDPSAVVWEGEVFRPGHQVRIRKWAGTFKPAETGAAEVHAAQGQVGVVVGGETRKSTKHLRIDPSEPIQIVRVRWLPQRWKESERDQSLELPEFQATIHVSYLERVR